MISLRQVGAAAGSFRVGPIDLDLPGATCALLGPSGAGKSTLLGAIAGVIPGDGEVRLGERDLLALPPEARRIGYVPQGGLLFPHLRVDENVGFGVPLRERRARVAEALARVGAEGLARRDPRSLSGGERMRVALARALAIRPRLLLLDEPLAALDPAAREALLPLLASLPGALGGTPVLLVTHDFEEAVRLADHLAILIDGRLAAAGPPETIFARPPSAEVAAFLRIDNLLAGSFEPAGADLSLFRHGALAIQVAGAFSGPGWLAFDGSALLLAGAPPPGASARNVFEGEVAAIAPLQRGLLVTVACAGAELRARVTPDAREALALEPGRRVAVLLKATAPQVLLREAR